MRHTLSPICLRRFEPQAPILLVNLLAGRLLGRYYFCQRYFCDVLRLSVRKNIYIVQQHFKLGTWHLLERQKDAEFAKPCATGFFFLFPLWIHVCSLPGTSQLTNTTSGIFLAGSAHLFYICCHFNVRWAKIWSWRYQVDSLFFLQFYFHCTWIQTLIDRRIWPTIDNDRYSQHKPVIILPHSTANCFLGNKKTLSAPKEQLHCTLWMHIRNDTQNSSQSKLVYWLDGSSEDGRVQETWAFCALNSHQGN